MLGKFWNQTVSKVRTTAVEVQQQFHQTAARAKEAITQYGKQPTAQQLENSLRAELSSVNSLVGIEELCERWLKQIIFSSDPHAPRYEEVSHINPKNPATSSLSGTAPMKHVKPNSKSSGNPEIDDTSVSHTTTVDKNVHAFSQTTAETQSSVSVEGHSYSSVEAGLNPENISISSEASPNKQSNKTTFERDNSPEEVTFDSVGVDPVGGTMSSSKSTLITRDGAFEDALWAGGSSSNSIQAIIPDKGVNGGTSHRIENFVSVLIKDGDIQSLNEYGGGSIWFTKGHMAPKGPLYDSENKSLIDLLLSYSSFGYTFKEVFLRSDLLELLLLRIFRTPELIPYISGSLDTPNDTINGNRRGTIPSFEEGLPVRQWLLKLLNECLMGGENLHRRLLSLIMTMDPSWKGHMEAITRLVSIIKWDWKYERLLDLRRLMLEDMIHYSAAISNWIPPSSPSSHDMSNTDENKPTLVQNSQPTRISFNPKATSSPQASTSTNTSKLIPPVIQKTVNATHKAFDSIKQSQISIPFNGLTQHNIRIITSRALIQLHQLLEANIQQSSERRKFYSKLINYRIKQFSNKMKEKKDIYQNIISMAAQNQLTFQDEGESDFNLLNTKIDELNAKYTSYNPRKKQLEQKREELQKELIAVQTELNQLETVQAQLQQSIDECKEKQSLQQAMHSDRIVSEKTDEITNQNKLSDIKNLLTIAQEAQIALLPSLLSHSQALKNAAQMIQDPVVKLLSKHLTYEKDRLVYQNLLITSLYSEDTNNIPLLSLSSTSDSLSTIPSKITTSISPNSHVTPLMNINMATNNLNSTNASISPREIGLRTLAQIDTIWNDFSNFAISCEKIFKLPITVNEYSILSQKVYDEILREPSWDDFKIPINTTKPKTIGASIPSTEITDSTKNTIISYNLESSSQHSPENDTSQTKLTPLNYVDLQSSDASPLNSKLDKPSNQEHSPPEPATLNFKPLLDELETLHFMLKEHISTLNNLQNYNDLKDMTADDKPMRATSSKALDTPSESSPEHFALVDEDEDALSEVDEFVELYLTSETAEALK